MQYNPVVLHYESPAERFNIIPMGDIHLGNVGCDVRRLKDLVRWIANKDNTYWLGMGDYIDAINYTDPRFDPKTVDKRYLAAGDLDKMIQMQINDLIDILEPIADKCLGLHRGNHEEKIRREYHYDILYELWRGLCLNGTAMLYDAALTRLKFVRGRHVTKVDIFSAHGNVGGRKGGNKINRLEDLMGYFDADIYLLAHSHIKVAEVKTTLYFDNRGNLRQKKRILAVTGCFLKSYEKGKTSYAERFLLPPNDLGVIKIMISPEDGDIHVSE